MTTFQLGTKLQKLNQIRQKLFANSYNYKTSNIEKVQEKQHEQLPAVCQTCFKGPVKSYPNVQPKILECL